MKWENIMFRNWLLRTTISIVTFTLIMAVFWGVQYSLNTHLLSSVTGCLAQYGIGVLLCSVFMGMWTVRKKPL